MTETSNASANNHRRRHPLPHAGHVTPAQTLQWLAAGWKTFTASPGTWIIQTLILIVVLSAVGIVPLLGWALAPLVLPVLAAGMLAGAHALDQGEPLRIDHLFDGVRRHAGNLLMIGGFHLLGALLAALIAAAVGSSAALTGMLVGAFAGVGLAAGGVMLAVAVFTVLWVLLLMALWFAPALVMLQNVSPLDAMKLSAQACLSNFVSFLVLGLTLYIVTWLAMLPAGLGILVLVPVLAGALHAAWKDTFGESRPALLAPAADSRSTPDNAA
ncbi:BPSS1780 family membrane protein [Azoarcus sp. KH32C]|uniref:BPSS1780 family membrane protein n=1 Tax=Azoarcus sp. KH32C TaxID=748247 RepID=UPI0002385FA3|nr:BPSS1780 family membrane protein [Azoarcus sp. KH32C]BAL22932.1 putative transmembrane protein [Azoarcus sp. KH32C]